MNKILLILFLPLLVFISAHAANSSNDSWQNLSPDMKTLLGEYKNEWAGIPIEQRKRLIERGQTWLENTDTQRNKLWQRYQRWQAMSQQQRLNMQQSYNRFQKLSKADRHLLINSQKRFNQLTPVKQQKMMQRFSEFQQRGGQIMPNTMKQKNGNNLSPNVQGTVNIPPNTMVKEGIRKMPIGNNAGIPPSNMSGGVRSGGGMKR